MAKIGRNDPCLCGSGQKYKNCHMAADEARAAELRAIRQAPDKLIPRLIEALGDYADATPAALSRFWQEKYTIDQASGLDDLEERGSERFMTWMLFDYALGDGTPLAQIAADPDREWSPAERTLLDGWREVRLQPYRVAAVHKGDGLTLTPLLGEGELHVHDIAAAKHIPVDEVLVVHLLPIVDDMHYITGAAAQLSPDTVAQFHEFAALYLADLQLQQPEATYADLIRERSEIFNHWVMALPRDAKEMTRMELFVATTRAKLAALRPGD